MPAEPQIKPLAYKKRKWFFRVLILSFIVIMPLVVFYATGYRFDFSKESPIISTGGIYISVPVDNADIYINEELVRDIRVFRRASYIQNLNAGIHRVHVQSEGLQTWVKELPVQSHIVTEVQSFNMPVVPQIRLIGGWISGTGRQVFPKVATSTIANKFSFASTTEQVLASTTIATTTLTVNQEYDFVRSLFGTTTESETLVGRVVQGVNEAFVFTEGSTTATATPTTTIVNRDMKLYESDGEVYATWLGRDNEIPYYFCVNYQAASSTVTQYGKHVYEGVATVLATMPITETQNLSGRICRDTIRIDRKGKEVKMFDFFPNSIDLVLLLLDDGLYVTEIDDRAWQNVQLLYPGNNIDARVSGGRIYVKDGNYLMEVLTELSTQ